MASQSKSKEHRGAKEVHSRPSRKGAVKITLHSANNEIDEKAELTVSLQNPESAVERMLHTLAQRFPPESVVTISPEKGGLLSATTSSSAPSESGEVPDDSRFVSSSASHSRSQGNATGGDTFKDFVEGPAYNHLPMNVRTQVYDFPPDIVRFLISNDPKYLEDFLRFSTDGVDSTSWARANGLDAKMVRATVELMTRNAEFSNWVSRLSSAVRQASSDGGYKRRKQGGSKSGSKPDTTGAASLGSQRSPAAIFPSFSRHAESGGNASVPHRYPVIGPDGAPIYHADGRPVTSDRRQILGPDGLPVYGQNGEPVFMPPMTQYGSKENFAVDHSRSGGSPYLYDDTGKQVVSYTRNVYGPDGRLVYGADGEPLVIGEDGGLRTGDGHLVFFNDAGIPVLDQRHGPPLLGPNRRPLVTASGERVIGAGLPIYNSAGQKMRGPDGNVIRWDEGEGRAQANNGQQTIAFGATGAPIFAFNERPVVIESRPIVDHTGTVVCGVDGRPLKIGAEGRLQNAANQPFVIGPNGEIMDSDGYPLLSAQRKPILGKDGRPLLAVGNPVYEMDGSPAYTNDGHDVVIGAQGFIEAGGKRCFFGPDGTVNFGPMGRPAQQYSVPVSVATHSPRSHQSPPHSVHTGSRSHPADSPRSQHTVAISAGGNVQMEAAGQGIVRESSQRAYSAHQTYVEDGVERPVYGAHGQIVRGPDGKPLRYTYDGIVTLADRRPVQFDVDGSPRMPDGAPLLDGGRAILGADGRPLFAPGSPVYGPGGKALYTTDGQAIVYGAKGRMESADGRLVDFGSDGSNAYNRQTHYQSAEEHTETRMQSEVQIPAGGHILSSEMINGEKVTYVEVPVYEERVVHVTKKQIVEVEKRVQKLEYVDVEKIVEVPEVQWVDRQVEVPRIQEIVRHVPRREVVEVPKEVIRHVPRVEIRQVEKIVEVPGEIIEVPKPYTVENKVSVPVYKNRDVNTVVAQKLQPVIRQTKESTNVDAKTYEPVLFPVDVFIPKPITSGLIAGDLLNESHNCVDVPPAQYNSLLRNLNTGIEQEHFQDLFVRAFDGTVPMLPTSELADIVSPVTHNFAGAAPSAPFVSGQPTVAAQMAGGSTTREKTRDSRPSQPKSSRRTEEKHSKRSQKGREVLETEEVLAREDEAKRRSGKTVSRHHHTLSTGGDGRHAYRVERLDKSGKKDRSRIIIVEETESPKNQSARSKKRHSRTLIVERGSTHSSERTSESVSVY